MNLEVFEEEDVEDEEGIVDNRDKGDRKTPKII